MYVNWGAKMESMEEPAQSTHPCLVIPEGMTALGVFPGKFAFVAHPSGRVWPLTSEQRAALRSMLLNMMEDAVPPEPAEAVRRPAPEEEEVRSVRRRAPAPEPESEPEVAVPFSIPVEVDDSDFAADPFSEPVRDPDRPPPERPSQTARGRRHWTR